VPSMRPLEARRLWCRAGISSDRAMMVSTMSWNSGTSPVSWRSQNLPSASRAPLWSPAVVEAVELPEGLLCGFGAGVRVEQGPEPGLFGVGEGVAASRQSEPGSEHSGLQDGLGARGAALDVAAHRGGPRLEPSGDVEPVQHAPGVSQAGVDGGLVGARAVGEDRLDSLAPLVALLRQQRRKRSGAAVRDHRQGGAGVGVDDHGHIAATSADRGLIDWQHPAALAAAALGDDAGEGPHQRVDLVRPTPRRRAGARRVITFASATKARARRAVRPPSKP